MIHQRLKPVLSGILAISGFVVLGLLSVACATPEPPRRMFVFSRQSEANQEQATIIVNQAQNGMAKTYGGLRLHLNGQWVPLKPDSNNVSRVQIEPGVYDMTIEFMIYRTERRVYLLKGSTLYIDLDYFKLFLFSDTPPVPTTRSSP